MIAFFRLVVLSESVPDVDKVLLNVEAKEFTMERSTLQSLQQLIQWVADLALNILAKLPESRSFMANKSQGVSYIAYQCSAGFVIFISKYLLVRH